MPTIHARRIAHRRALALLCLGIIAITAGLTGSRTAQAQLRTDVIGVRFFQITVEIADTPASRTQGLMGRRSLPLNHGMLFVFERPETQCFWMKNTPLPLTIAFIADDGRIVNFADMQPLSEQPHCSVAKVRYALEMEQGWFKQRGVLVGDAVTLPPSLRATPPTSSSRGAEGAVANTTALQGF